MKSELYDCLIVGAGISGLACAHELMRLGKSVLVLEKSKGVGGRMACRRIWETRADHGAQYFTVRDQQFEKVCSSLAETVGLINVGWDEKDRWVSPLGMSALPKAYSEGVDVVLSCEVNSVVRADKVWEITSVDGQAYRAHHLVMSSPVPQSLYLLRDYREQIIGFSELEKISYDRTLTLLLAVEAADDEFNFVEKYVSNEVILYLANQKNKQLSNKLVLSIHSTDAFARAYWDEDPSVWSTRMIEELRSQFSFTVLDRYVHRWKFSTVRTPYAKGNFYYDRSLALSLVGDGFIAPRVESAFLSGYQAAQEI